MNNAFPMYVMCIGIFWHKNKKNSEKMPELY